MFETTFVPRGQICDRNSGWGNIRIDTHTTAYLPFTFSGKSDIAFELKGVTGAFPVFFLKSV